MATPPSLVLGISLFRPGEAPQHSEMCVDPTTTVADVRNHLHHKLGVPPSRQRWLALQQRHAGCQLYMPAGYDNTMVALMLDDCRTLASYGGLRPDLEIHAAAAASPATAFGYAPPEMTAAHLSTIKEGGVNGGGCGFGSGGSGLSSEASVAAAVFEDEFASAPLPPPAAPSTTAAAPVTSVTSAAGLSSGASDSCVLSGPGGGSYVYGCRQSTEATTTQFANLMFGRASAPAAPLTTAAALFSLQHCQQQQQQQCPPALLSAFASECAAASGSAGAGGSSSAQQHWLHSSGAAHSGMMHSSGSQMVLQPSGSLASVQRLVGDMYESYEDPSGRSLFLM